MTDRGREKDLKFFFTFRRSLTDRDKISAWLDVMSEYGLVGDDYDETDRSITAVGRRYYFSAEGEITRITIGDTSYNDKA